MAQPPERRGSGVDRLEHPTQIPDPEGHPIIPPLRNFAPAIFRPISYDEPLSDIISVTRLDHLKAQLKSIDDHAQSFRQNFVALCIRERERILQEGRRCEVLDKQEDTVSPDVPLGVESDTLDSMISNMLLHLLSFVDHFEGVGVFYFARAIYAEQLVTVANNTHAGWVYRSMLILFVLFPYWPAFAGPVSSDCLIHLSWNVLFD